MPNASTTLAFAWKGFMEMALHAEVRTKRNFLRNSASIKISIYFVSTIYPLPFLIYVVFYQEIPHPCHPNPCKNEAKCKELEDGEYDCECPPGTSGKHCEGKKYVTEFSSDGIFYV